MARRPTIFGIDEEVIDEVVQTALGLNHVALQGFHVYAGTQCLDPEAIAENIRNIAGIFGRLIDQHNLTVEHLVFGSGFGIRYHAGADELDPVAVASSCVAEIDALRSRPGAASATMALEMGRYLVGEAGWFLTRVLGTKHTRGADLLALDGGMNHYLGASGNLGGVLKRNYPVEAVTGDAGREGTYDLCGPLCTNIDALGKGIETRGLEVGDIVAIGCAGAYGLTSSPTHFISHAPPREILLPAVDAADAAVDITADGPGITPLDWTRFAD
jgi:diaminopimelate decarboxylase